MEQWMTISIIFHNQTGDHLPRQGWSKWGGARSGLEKGELEEWYCQICGDKQINVLPCYMFPVDGLKREFVRACTTCKAKSVEKKVQLISDLLRIIR